MRDISSTASKAKTTDPCAIAFAFRTPNEHVAQQPLFASEVTLQHWGQPDALTVPVNTELTFNSNFFWHSRNSWPTILKSVSTADRPNTSGANRPDSHLAARLTRAREWAESRLTDPALRVSQMAEVACLSPCHFTVVYKDRFGCSPYESILYLRGELAVEALRCSQTPIAQIAHECGFSNQSHMTSFFKKRFGMTPGQLRRKESSHVSRVEYSNGDSTGDDNLRPEK